MARGSFHATRGLAWVRAPGGGTRTSWASCWTWRAPPAAGCPLRAARPLVGTVDDGTVDALGTHRGDDEPALGEGGVCLGVAGG